MIEQHLEVLDRLLEDFYRLEIEWTEASLLSPEYLHLHEQDIPGETSYEMREQLAGFLYSIPAARRDLEEVVFCYSREEAPEGILPARQCLGQHYFSYRIRYPHRHATVEELQQALHLSDSHHDGRPKAWLIQSPQTERTDLLSVLSQTHVMQPYLLFSKGGAHVEAEFRIKPTTEAEISKLIEDFSSGRRPRGAGYQFSWYGYAFKEEQAETWIHSKAHQLYLEIAFLHHIHKWNFDLRNAHKFETARQGRITQILKELQLARSDLAKRVNSILELIPAVSQESPAPPTVIAVVDRDGALEPTSGLFGQALGHDIESFPSDQPNPATSAAFDLFLRRVEKHSSRGAINGSRTLRTSLRKSSVPKISDRSHPRPENFVGTGNLRGNKSLGLTCSGRKWFGRS